MMKKFIFLLFFLVLISSVIFYIAQKPTNMEESNSEILTKKESNIIVKPDYDSKRKSAKKIAQTKKNLSKSSNPEKIIYSENLDNYKRFLPDDIKNSEQWKKLSNYKKDIFALLEEEKNDLESLAETAVSVNKHLSKCLVKNNCGLVPSKDKALFISNQTRAHDMLSRSLSIFAVISENDVSILNKLPTQDLINNLQIENDNIQALSLELLSKKDLNNQEYKNIFSQTSLDTTDAKRTLFTVFDKKSKETKYRRNVYLNSLQNTFNKNNPSVVIEVMKGINNLNLSKEEWLKIAKKLCKFDTKEQKHNWMAIKYHADEYAESHGIEKQIDQVCN